LVPPKNFNALAENIINLLQNKALLEKFSRNNPETAKKFDFFKMIEETEKIYQYNISKNIFSDH
ncbi:glycosyltransferase family 4 protein, partial [Candidatus Kuenenbacteria bacterium]|nr:glycosyltransferase family 4 protein [Candidatus Kuenenbacteria bacterium]